MTEEKEYYTARQAAKYLGIPMHRLARLRRQGRIKSVVEDADARYATYHIDQLKGVDVSDLRRKKDDKGDDPSSTSVGLMSRSGLLPTLARVG